MWNLKAMYYSPLSVLFECCYKHLIYTHTVFLERKETFLSTSHYCLTNNLCVKLSETIKAHVQINLQTK